MEFKGDAEGWQCICNQRKLQVSKRRLLFRGRPFHKQTLLVDSSVWFSLDWVCCVFERRSQRQPRLVVNSFLMHFLIICFFENPYCVCTVSPFLFSLQPLPGPMNSLENAWPLILWLLLLKIYMHKHIETLLLLVCTLGRLDWTTYQRAVRGEDGLYSQRSWSTALHLGVQSSEKSPPRVDQ